jgi:hypothetical protein
MHGVRNAMKKKCEKKGRVYAIPAEALQDTTRDVLAFLFERVESAHAKDPNDAFAAIALDFMKTQRDLVVLFISTSIAFAIGNKDRIPCQALEGDVKDGRITNVREIFQRYLV